MGVSSKKLTPFFDKPTSAVHTAEVFIRTIKKKYPVP